jgi:Na+/H+-dicarboxylate symporter
MIVLASAPLLKMIYSSLIAGISVAVVFSVAVFGVIRSSDMRRANRAGASARYATLGLLALLASVAIAIGGLIVVIHKS